MKYISFALFGSDQKYRRGMLNVIDSAPDYFPGWQLLIYCDAVNHAALTAENLPAYVECIRQKDISQGVEGMSWRFLAALRPDAEAVLFRDADSAFTHREKRAVEEWWASSCDTHIIRDHPYHRSPVMGGLLGVRGAAMRLLARTVEQKKSAHRLTEYGDDQVFLTSEFYPKVRRTALVHTNCVRYFPEYTTPLPDDQSGQSFIGAYAFLSAEEQAKYEGIRRSEPPVTLFPDDLKRIPLLRKVLKKLDGRSGLKHHCRWCL